MTRQSISLTKQNDECLKSQISEGEFNSKIEAINYLRKKTRERDVYHDFVQMKIDRGLKSGFAEKQTREEMLSEFKKRLENE